MLIGIGAGVGFPQPSGGSSPSYSAVAVSFDGTNDYLSRGSKLTGAADGKQGLVSFWVNPQLAATNQYIYIGQNLSSLMRYQAFLNTTNQIQFDARNSAGTTILSMQSASGAFGTAGWRHVLATWDLAAGVGQIYVNDVSDRAGSPTLTNDTIPYSSDTSFFNVGANTSAALKLNAYIADLYINFATTLDLSVEANRRKFISSGLKPVSLGANGETPTGSSPIVFLANPLASWETNLGTGGGFTENGALTAAPSSPSD